MSTYQMQLRDKQFVQWLALHPGKAPAPMAGSVRQQEKNMKKLMTATKAFWNDEEGATAIEYGLMVALIAVVIIAAVQTIGVELDKSFDRIVVCLTKPADCK